MDPDAPVGTLLEDERGATNSLLGCVIVAIGVAVAAIALLGWYLAQVFWEMIL